MANKMLIDATHPEETRVVVLRGNRVEEFDFESANRRQLRGNIYLAKVTRVEPSLQAAFVEYGGNRHGFLAFSEIHPDYYQIPVADRQALIEEEERAQREADDEVERRAGRRRGRGAQRRRERIRSEPIAPTEGTEPDQQAAETTADPALGDAEQIGETPAGAEAAPAASEEHGAAPQAESPEGVAAAHDAIEPSGADADETPVEARSEPGGESAEPPHVEADLVPELPEPENREGEHAAAEHGNGNGVDENGDDEEVVESVGGDDALDEATERMPRIRRQYKIQEVIKRRQIMLVQVVKEERGTKGAALTTYLSLAGRYAVLMPNTARGGGISRKITNALDRKRLKDVAQDLEVPDGMGVILRTAGANRTKAEIKRDFEYLLRMWEQVRDLTLKSTAPTLVYEEGSLIKRSINGIESQLDAMFSPVVQLKSGGYIVLNQAEALVAIDVNSGRATREHHIEDTALKTNIEAADEIARQLRLRDLAGLIVIDFIDMDEKRNNRSVERRLKESLKHDRARIQVGRISHFGLLEMSRQRIRTSVLESSTEKCTLCGGTGHVRSVASVTLQLLRSLEEMLIKGATHNLIVRTRAEVALYVLNHKRAHLRDLETRFRITITINSDPTISGQQPFVIDRGEQVHSIEAAKAIAVQPASAPVQVEEEEEEEEEEEAAEEASGESEAEAESDGGEPRRRRRRRRRRGGEEREGGEFTHETAAEHGVEHIADDADAGADEVEEAEETAPGEARETSAETRGESERRRRRRGRRGGRRNRREGEAFSPDAASVEPELTSAVADFDRPAEPAAPREPASEEFGSLPPPATQPEPPEPPEATPAEPVAPVPISPVVQPPDAEAPRRRSTVREPAPFVIGSGEAPVASPPASTPQASAPIESVPEMPEEAGQPRRTGWWSRRSMADKR